MASGGLIATGFGLLVLPYLWAVTTLLLRWVSRRDLVLGVPSWGLFTGPLTQEQIQDHEKRIRAKEARWARIATKFWPGAVGVVVVAVALMATGLAIR